MKISDVTCLKCGSSYLMAESISVKASTGREDCAVCGNTLAIWSDRRRKSFRLVLSPEHKYPPVSRRRASNKTGHRAERDDSIPNLGKVPSPASSPGFRFLTFTQNFDLPSRWEWSRRFETKPSRPCGRRPEGVRSDLALLKVAEENPVRPASQEAGEVRLTHR
jgi:hypothetical protein